MIAADLRRLRERIIRAATPADLRACAATAGDLVSEHGLGDHLAAAWCDHRDLAAGRAGWVCPACGADGTLAELRDALLYAHGLVVTSHVAQSAVRRPSPRWSIGS